MNTSENTNEPTADHFTSPSALRQFALDTATQLRQAGLSEAADVMEAAANFPATTGSEWLGELGIASKTIGERFKLSEVLRAKVVRIARTAASRRPYG